MTALIDRDYNIYFRRSRVRTKFSYIFESVAVSTLEPRIRFIEYGGPVYERNTAIFWFGNNVCAINCGAGSVKHYPAGATIASLCRRCFVAKIPVKFCGYALGIG